MTPLLALSDGVIFGAGAVLAVGVLWAAFALALARFSELAERSEGERRDGR